MKLWSRGLGRTEIDMDFRYYQVVKDPESGLMTIVGCMQSPVTWEFTLKLEPDDIAGIIKLALNVPLLTFVAKNIYRYPIYLMNRDKYRLEDEEHLAQRVFAVYEKMREGGKGRKKRAKKSETKSEAKGETKRTPKRGSKRKTANVEVQEIAASGA